MTPTKTNAYQCPKCNDLWANHRHASDCCDVRVRASHSKDAWQCGKCAKLFLEKDKAELCCAKGRKGKAA